MEGRIAVRFQGMYCCGIPFCFAEEVRVAVEGRAVGFLLQALCIAVVQRLALYVEVVCFVLLFPLMQSLRRQLGVDFRRD